MSKPKTLYHFTCEHGFKGISESHAIQAHVHPLMRSLGPLVWLTEDPHPTAESVGFGGPFSQCDHMAYRYVVTTKAAIHWSELRRIAPHDVVSVLEAFGEPSHWWVMRRSALLSEFALDTPKEHVA